MLSMVCLDNSSVKVIASGESSPRTRHIAEINKTLKGLLYFSGDPGAS